MRPFGIITATMRHCTRVAVIALIALPPTTGVAQVRLALRPPQGGMGPRLTVRPVAHPVPVRADGRLHLVYELLLASFDSRELRIEKLDVFADRRERPLASYDSTGLARVFFRPGDTLGLPHPHRIVVGTHVIAYLWITLDSAATAPTSLTHRFAITAVEGAREDTATLEPAPLIVSRDAPTVIGPPLRGGPWFGNNGPSNDSRHRRVLIPYGGELQLGQRFAFDWVKFRGDESGLPDPATYGSEVLAVADARVAEVIDGIPENWAPPGRPTSRDARAVPMTPATARGNVVVLELAPGRFAHFAHLQPRSIRVRQGDRVRRGQVLGLLGNSGNSTGPHLHFQVSDSPGVAGNGLPFVFDSVDVFAIVPRRPDWREHVVRFPPGQGARRNEMPLLGWAIRFP
ncbi:MAG TPA: M23 family metallopeptidase [Gemmatimonadaceae bacterium]|nr:M23 family metallopeptidase [Gemmatimonadaceae bacterium]